MLAKLAAVAITLFLLVTACSEPKSAEQRPGGGLRATMGSGSATAAVASSMVRATPALSPFEDDPAVVTLREFATQGARAVNAGKTDTPELRATLTRTEVANLELLWGPEIGLRYPGPLPMLILAVTALSPMEKRVDTCQVSAGFGVDPTTGRPPKPLTLLAVDPYLTLVDGKWLVSKVPRTQRYSCAGLTVAMPKW